MRTQGQKHLTLRRGQFVGWLVLIAVVLWILPRHASASDTAKKDKPAARKSASKKTVHRKSSTRHTSRRRSNFRARLARLQLEPSRIEEIQQALIREGYLAQEPTGKWDDATRSAMRRYQDKNGFSTTGLPEAKSLMKLGLGSHPLPEDVDPTVVGRASINSPHAGSTTSESPAASDSR